MQGGIATKVWGPGKALVAWLSFAALGAQGGGDALANEWSRFKTGAVAAKGLVLGPNQKPLWAEFGPDGSVTRDVGEASSPPLDSATVVAAEVYQGSLDRYAQLRAGYGTQLEVLTRADYEGRTFAGANGQVAAKPPLEAGTVSVVVRKPVVTALTHVLHESPLNLGRLSTLAPSTRSVLISSDGVVLHQGVESIGFHLSSVGPHGNRVWAELLADGTVVSWIGEAYGPFENASVLTASAYRVLVEQYRAVYAAHSAHLVVMGRAAYAAASFRTADGLPVTKQGLAAATRYVALQTPAVVTAQLVLQQSSIDLARALPLAQGTRTVLLDKDGRVVTSSTGNLGFRTAYFSPKANPTARSNQLGVLGYSRSDDLLWAPIEGALVSLSGWPYPVSTGADGRYALLYQIPPCPGYSWEYPQRLTAELRFQKFNPAAPGQGALYLSREFTERCSGLASGVSATSTGGAMLQGALGVLDSQTEYWANQDVNTRADFSVNVALLTGYASLEGARGTLPLAPDTEYESAPPAVSRRNPELLDRDGDGKNDLTSVNPDGSVSIWLGNSDPGTDPPDLVRRSDADWAFEDQGLVKAVSARDLKNTDLYVFRTSNGELVAALEGLTDSAVGTTTQARVNYQVGIQGPAVNQVGDETSFLQQAAQASGPNVRRGAGFAKWQADHLRVGERVRVVLVNRATGYVGTGSAVYGAGVRSGDVTLSPGAIAMRPPNLKVRVERVNTVAAGGTRGQRRRSLIGSEGAGLTTDTYLQVTTEWVDQDGSPLPDALPGFTGRLAKVVAPNLLGQASSKVTHFDISPGRHTQLLKLPQPGLDAAHYYVHVSGQPKGRNPDFTTLGAGTGALAPRPKHYVPVLVAVYDEETTLAGRRAGSGAGLTYRWVRRPEMQFSLFELQRVEGIDPVGAAVNLVTPSAPLPLSIDHLTFTYALLGDALPALTPFSPARTFVFALGGWELAAAAAASPTPSRRLDFPWVEPGDWVTLRLYQHGDDENVLWEYALYAVDLDIDSDNGQEWQPPLGGASVAPEDRVEAAEGRPGKYVGANTGDADADGVPNYADGFDLWGNAGTGAGGRFTPVVLRFPEPLDPARVVVRFTYSASNPAFVARPGAGTPADPYLYVPDQGNLRLWKADGTRSRKKADVSAGGDFVQPGSPYSAAQLGVQGRTGVLYVEGIWASTTPGDQWISVEVDPDGPGPAGFVCSDWVRLTVLNVEMVPDVNLDGVIDVADQGKVTAARPWRFWVNDDDDGASGATTGTANGLLSTSLADLPGQQEDNSDARVNGIRDLVDFFPLHLDLGRALLLCPPSWGCAYKLRQDDGAVALFEAFDSVAPLRTTKPHDYLNDLDTTERYGDRGVGVATATGVYLTPVPLEFVRAEAAAQRAAGVEKPVSAGIVLVEGLRPSTKPLLLDVVKNEKTVATFEFPLELVSVKEMYGHKDLRGVAGGVPGDSDRFAGPGSSGFEPAKLPYGQQGGDKALVWTHGYNVNSDDATATFAEVFKRFFHAGFRGRFYGVSWYGDPPSQDVLSHYHQAVVNAFATAKAYAEFVRAVPGTVSVGAHSLGNLMVGEAIQNHALPYNKYFAVNAAVPLEAYGEIRRPYELVYADGTFSSDPAAAMLMVEDWPAYVAAGGSKLLASEWHTLFDPATDNRALLTWRNRLKDVPSDRMYNFYSSTEEVLERVEDDSLLAAGVFAGAWAKQEKLKGRRTVDVAGATSNYCGWSFNREWDQWTSVSFGQPSYVKLAPTEAALIPNADLITKPFFELHVSTLAPEPDLENLVTTVNGVTPSDFVMKWVKDTPLKDYYTKNAPAHALVTVRDWLLAEAFPALTLPAGANKNGMISGRRNVDMFLECATNLDRWPRRTLWTREPLWHHSDYKDIAYQHTRPFYLRVLAALSR